MAGNQLEHQFSAILAHELRDPLAAILIALDAMRDNRIDNVVARDERRTFPPTIA